METITIVLWILGLFFLILSVFSTVVFIIFQRRKLIVTNFLNDNGRWERKFWKELPKKFEYNKLDYVFNIEKCTRDKWNRPVAHYYVGNPVQMEYDVKNNSNKKILIGTSELTQKDFKTILLTKILQDIFSENEDLVWFIIILIAIIGVGILLFIALKSHTPTCDLTTESINQIKMIMRPPLNSQV